jgi:hypothetical protein
LTLLSNPFLIRPPSLLPPDARSRQSVPHYSFLTPQPAPRDTRQLPLKTIPHCSLLIPHSSPQSYRRDTRQPPRFHSLPSPLPGTPRPHPRFHSLASSLARDTRKLPRKAHSQARSPGRLASFLVKPTPQPAPPQPPNRHHSSLLIRPPALSPGHLARLLAFTHPPARSPGTLAIAYRRLHSSLLTAHYSFTRQPAPRDTRQLPLKTIPNSSLLITHSSASPLPRNASPAPPQSSLTSPLAQDARIPHCSFVHKLAHPDDSPAFPPSLTPQPPRPGHSQPPNRHHYSLLTAHYSFVRKDALQDDSPASS